jgi:hypothetical protein
LILAPSILLTSRLKFNTVPVKVETVIDEKMLSPSGWIMKIRVRDEKIIKAIKNVEGIDIVLKSVEDAKKAMQLILRKTETSRTKDYEGLREIAITRVVEHTTSAVEYQTYYEVEFVLTDERFIDMEIALIKELQTMFEKL